MSIRYDEAVTQSFQRMLYKNNFPVTDLTCGRDHEIIAHLSLALVNPIMGYGVKIDCLLLTTGALSQSHPRVTKHIHLNPNHEGYCCMSRLEGSRKIYIPLYLWDK